MSDATRTWSLSYRLLTSVIAAVAPDLDGLGLDPKELFLLAELDAIRTRPHSLAEIDQTDLRRHRLQTTPVRAPAGEVELIMPTPALRSAVRLATAVLVVCLLTVPAVRGQVPGLTGTLVVTNKQPSTATIVDVASGRTLATLPTGPTPHEIVVSSDGALAVVTDYGGERRTLTVLDVPGLKVARTIDLGEHRAPHGIVFMPGDRLVAVTCEQTREVVIVDVVDGVVRHAVPTEAAGSHMVGVTADGAYGYTGNMRDSTVSQLDMKTASFVKSFKVPPVPEAINVTPDGREVWLGSNETGQVSVLDPATGTVTKAADGLKWPYRMLFTPDGAQVVVPDPTLNEVRFIDRATRTERGRLSLPGAPQGVTITPDGRYLFQSLSAETRVAIIDPVTRAVVGHLTVGATPDGVAYTTRVVAATSR